jgi:hypothetical protein
MEQNVFHNVLYSFYKNSLARLGWLWLNVFKGNCAP